LIYKENKLKGHLVEKAGNNEGEILDENKQTSISSSNNLFKNLVY